MNTVWFWALLAVFLVFLYVSQVAGRLDRLHIRVDNAWAALDGQLLRRSSVALEIGASGLLDPAASMILTQAAHDARETEDALRARTENELSSALQLVIPDQSAVSEISASPVGAELLRELAAVSRRVELGIAFLDEAVRSCELVRSRPMVRTLRLAGHAPWPRGLDLQPPVPEGLAPAT